MEIRREFISESHENLSRAENRFYRMTLILTIVFVLARTVDMISGILIRLIYFFELEFGFVSVVNLFRQITILIMLATHAFSAFIYVPRDSNLRELVLKPLHLEKVKEINILLKY